MASEFPVPSTSDLTPALPPKATDKKVRDDTMGACYPYSRACILHPATVRAVAGLHSGRGQRAAETAFVNCESDRRDGGWVSLARDSSPGKISQAHTDAPSKNRNVNLGKFGSFKGQELIGKPYGDTYEIRDGLLHVVRATITEIEETGANNENIGSVGAQGLTFDDIEAMRSEGLTGREIIQKQVEEHSAFDLKTGYSKEKYLKRKEAKYLQMFTPIEPTVHNICMFNFEKQPAKIRDLRPDTLSQLMTMANVRPGSRLLVVEEVHGMVVAAAIDRMGEGTILVINDVDSPPDLHLLESFNFSPDYLEPIISMNWAATERSYIPPDLPLEIPENTPKSKSIREQSKVKKRKVAFDKMQQTREEFFKGGFDSVIIASEYEPYSVLERLLPSIGGSAPIVVYSPYLQVLHEAHQKLRLAPEYLSPSISEPFLRKYQVLPGRTHPEMAGMGHGGYILHAIRVFDAEASSITSGRRDARKAKVEKERAKLETKSAPEEKVVAMEVEES